MWVQRGAGPTKQIAFSSTFDAVLAGDVANSDVYAKSAAPAVAAALEGKTGCVLCIGPAR